MFKFIKKIIIFPLFFIGIMITFGEEDCDPIKNNADTDRRVLTCDDVKATVTSYEYPKGVENWADSFTNTYCHVVCKENIMFSFEGIQQVYAGMGFSYPLNVAASRDCRATYKLEDRKFDNLYRKMIDAYMVLHGKETNRGPLADANGDGVINEKDSETVDSWKETLLTLDNKKILKLPNPVATLKKEILYMKKEKTDCDEWGENKGEIYSLNPDVNLEIENSKEIRSLKYNFVETTKPKHVKTPNKDTKSSCGLEEAKDDSGDMTCIEEETTTGWTSIDKISGRYTMPVVNLELYSGKVIDNPKSSIKTGQCIAGEVYFTDFEEVTRPVSSDKNDKGYSLVLNVKNIGNNIDKKVPKNLELKVTCSYQVKNISSPQKNTPKGADEMYKKYVGIIYNTSGLSLHGYRVIDVNDPFPGRDPLANWMGNVSVFKNGKIQQIPLKEYYIINKGAEIRTNNKYTIKLNSSNIKNILKYNETNPYGIHDLDQYESSAFIKDKPMIIEKGN